MRLAAVLAALGAAGIAAAVAASNAASDPADLHRPLHLPKLKPHQRCPLAPAADPGTGRILNGRGPVYLIGVGAAPRGVVDISQSARDALGWRGQKTPWAIDRSYDGPLLVRGARIDGRGSLRFAYGYGEHRRELSWPSGADQGQPADPRFRFLASLTLFRGAGCYAFQVDGTTFSEVVVVRAVRR
jgi:hypothetical protein